jgi:hypothetical protein
MFLAQINMMGNFLVGRRTENMRLEIRNIGDLSMIE